MLGDDFIKPDPLEPARQELMARKYSQIELWKRDYDLETAKFLFKFLLFPFAISMLLALGVSYVVR